MTSCRLFKIKFHR